MIKARLVHINPKSLRYQLAHYAFKDATIRNAHACEFYWGMLPLAVFSIIVLTPIAVVVWFLLARPIAWLSGYRRTDASLFVSPDVPDRERPDWFENAHRKIAPWRIVLPAMLVAGLVWLGFADPVNLLILVTLGLFGVFVTGVVLLVRMHGDRFTAICPRLHVDDTP